MSKGRGNTARERGMRDNRLDIADEHGLYDQALLDLDEATESANGHHRHPRTQISGIGRRFADFEFASRNGR